MIRRFHNYNPIEVAPPPHGTTPIVCCCGAREQSISSPYFSRIFPFFFFLPPLYCAGICGLENSPCRRISSCWPLFALGHYDCHSFSSSAALDFVYFGAFRDLLQVASHIPTSISSSVPFGPLFPNIFYPGGSSIHYSMDSLIYNYRSVVSSRRYRLSDCRVGSPFPLECAGQ